MAAACLVGGTRVPEGVQACGIGLESIFAELLGEWDSGYGWGMGIDGQRRSSGVG